MDLTPVTFFAIDPGPIQSAFAMIDSQSCKPLRVGKVDNQILLNMLYTDPNLGHVVIEMIASYGMAVGAEVFDTCVWIGRFLEAHHNAAHRIPSLVVRLRVKLHHCHSAQAKDSNIIQALVDRFAPEEPNRGKGSKAQPGWFHGFSADIWQAYALAVYGADCLEFGPR